MDAFLQDQGHIFLPSSVSGAGQLVRPPDRRFQILTIQQLVLCTASMRALALSSLVCWSLMLNRSGCGLANRLSTELVLYSGVPGNFGENGHVFESQFCHLHVKWFLKYLLNHNVLQAQIILRKYVKLVYTKVLVTHQSSVPPVFKEIRNSTSQSLWIQVSDLGTQILLHLMLKVAS